MAVAFDSQVDFSEEDSTTPTSTAAWTIASTANRFAIAALYARDFVTQATHSGMTLESVAMTQLGTTADIEADTTALISRWRLINPTAGSSQTLAGTLSTQQAVGLIACAVYNGVDQTTPIGSTPTPTEGAWDTTTTVSPSITVTTVTDGVAVAFLAMRHTDTTAPSITPGTGVSVRTTEHINLETLYILERANNGGSTVITADVTFPSSSGTWRMDAYAIAPASSGYTIVADSGTYNLTGQTANLIAGRVAVAEQGSYTLTGQDVVFSYNAARILPADFGSYTLVGSNALVDLSINAEFGSYALTGQAATLTYTPLGNFTITAEQGSYTLTGQDLSLLFGRLLVASQGSYLLNGIQTGFSYSGAPATSGYISQTMTFSRLKIGL